MVSGGSSVYTATLLKRRTTETCGKRGVRGTSRANYAFVDHGIPLKHLTKETFLYVNTEVAPHYSALAAT